MIRAHLSPIPAHVVVPGSGVTVVLWSAMALMIGGGAALISAHHRWQKWSGLVVVVIGVVATVAASVFASGVPASPSFSLSVAQPMQGAHVTSPVLVHVCGDLPGGGKVAVPESGQVVTVFLDGQQLQTVATATVYLTAPAGPHTLRVEVLTGDHREYQPPVATDISVVVIGPGLLAPAVAC